MAHRLTLRAALPAFALVSLALVGCDAPGLTSKVKSPSKAAAQPTGQATTTSAGLPQRAAPTSQSPAVFTPGLSVSDLIAQACGIKPRGKAVMPSFEYDSAALAEADREMLGEIARCLSEGALKGKDVVLVGRTDARGEPEYNLTLGESRADAVHRYLVDLGVGRGQMRATSRGEIDASGTDEEGWANDRRVDIELAL
ncbi:MAG: OmpA family protein [Labilithrix sp.]|nr:OmpA family protein [Labilithrix sp.]MBX3223715.1 OmpA family protein [Labilithrix sp.]